MRYLPLSSLTTARRNRVNFSRSERRRQRRVINVQPEIRKEKPSIAAGVIPPLYHKICSYHPTGQYPPTDTKCRFLHGTL